MKLLINECWLRNNFLPYPIFLSFAPYRELTNKGDEIKSRKRKTVNQLNLIESELNKWRRDRDKFAEVADKVGVTVKKSPKPISWKIPPRIEIPLERQISPGYKTKRFLPVNADYSTSKSAD